MIPSIQPHNHLQYTSDLKKHRPFKRYRYSPFSGLGKDLSNFWEKTRYAASITCKCTKSILGRVVVYSLADIGGGFLGSYVGSKAFHELGSDLGRVCTSKEFLTIAAILEMNTLYSRESHKEKEIILIAMIIGTIAVMTLTSQEDRNEYGSQIGGMIGCQAGDFVGTILGGYAFLKLAGSPTVFYDPKEPWNSYTFSTIRFLAVGKLFDLIVIKSSTPFIGSLVNLPRNIVRGTLQNLSYNSNAILPIIKESMRNKSMGKPQLPTIAKLFCNTYCGHNVEFFQQEFSKCSLKSIFPSLASLQSDFFRKIDRRLPFYLSDQVNFLTEKSDVLASKAISAFHVYTTVLSNSQEIKNEHEKMREAFFQENGNFIAHKNQIIKLLRSKIKRYSGSGASKNSEIWNQTVSRIVDAIFQGQNMQMMKNGFWESFKQMEIALMGFPMLSPHQTSYLNEMLEIYLQHYVIFLICYYDKFHELVREEENQSIEMLMNLIFKHYVHSITPASLAKFSQKVVNETMKRVIEFQKLIMLFFLQPEQRAQVYHREGDRLRAVNHVENHFDPIAEKIWSKSEMDFEYDHVSQNPMPLDGGEAEFHHVDERELKRDESDDDFDHVEKSED